MTHVLIVDDEPSICWAFRECLTDEGFSVDIAGTAEQALVIAAQNVPDVIVMDVRLPGMDGLKAMRCLRDKSVTVPVIIMTAFGSLKIAVDAIDGGAFDYLTKPIDLDKAVAVVRQAVSTLPKSYTAVTAVADLDDALIVGSSPKMQEVFRRIALVAERDVPVLITGESGTGKDLVARAIHQHSDRKGAFVPICIPALSETLAASEKSRLIATDVETLRLHYALTLRQWYQRVRENRAAIIESHDASFFRMWIFYLAGATAAFESGGMCNHQYQFVRDRRTLQLNRDYMTEAERLYLAMG